MPPVFEVIKPGIFSTIQDGGFTGYRSSGIPTGGAVDRFSLRVANILAGNDQYAAALEVTVNGPVLRVLKDTAIAVTGGDLTPLVNGEPLPMWETLFVGEGGIITFGSRQCGCRSYLAVAGGFDVPPVLGARSTYTRACIGGVDGRPLRKGDILKTQSGSLKNYTVLKLPTQHRPVYNRDLTLRVLPGPHFKLFSRSSVHDFISATFIASERADRMGILLNGKTVKAPAGERLSQPVTPGSVQIPPDGKPIILLAECQTIGGYAHIGTVITADHNLAGQLFPGDSVGFTLVSMETALAELLQQEKTIAGICPVTQVRRFYRTARYRYEIIVEQKDCLDTGDKL